MGWPALPTVPTTPPRATTRRAATTSSTPAAGTAASSRNDTLSIHNWSPGSYGLPSGPWQGREGHYFHTAGGITADTQGMWTANLGTGVNNLNLFANTLLPLHAKLLNSNNWQPGLTSPPTLPGVPTQYAAWSYSSAVSVDSRLTDSNWPGSNSYVTVLYGGYYTNNGRIEIDPSLWIVNGNDKTLTRNVVDPGAFVSPTMPPWGAARHGMAMAGFNATSGLDQQGPFNPARGRIVFAGGFDNTGALYNDVWVLYDDKHSSSTGTFASNNLGAANWSPRWGAQAFDGGRNDVFMYGGYDSGNSWQSQVWYASFGPDALTTKAPLDWTAIMQVASGPSYKPGCSVAYWLGDDDDEDEATLYLVMMGSATDGREGGTPSSDLFYGLVSRS